MDAVVNGQRRIDRLRASLVGLNGPTRTLNRSFGGLQTAIAAAFSIVAVQRFTSAITEGSDAVTGIENQLRAAGVAAEDLPGAFRDIVQLSEQNRASIEATGGLFARVLRSSRDLGVSQEQALTISTAFQRSLALSGASAQEAAASSLQFGQALASGRLQGDELRSILENNSVFAQAFAAELGVGVGRLREMGAEGQLTSELLADVAQRIAPDINRRFAELTPTFEQVGELVRNRLTLAFSALGQEIRTALGDLQGVAVSLGDTLAGLVQRITLVFRAIRENAEGARVAVLALAGAITGFLIPALIRMATVILTRVASALLFLLSPIGIILGALGAIGAVAAVAFDEVADLAVAVGSRLAIGAELGVERFILAFNRMTVVVRDVFNSISASIAESLEGILAFFVDGINDFIAFVNTQLERLGRDPIELMLEVPDIEGFSLDTSEAQDAIDEQEQRISELEAEAEAAYNQILESGGALADALATSFGSASEFIDGLRSSFTQPIEVLVDSPEAPTGMDPVEMEQEVQTNLQMALGGLGEFDNTRLGEDITDNLQDSIQDALDTGNFRDLGKNILGSISMSINEQAAEQLTGLLTGFFQDIRENGSSAFTDLFATIDGGLGGLLSKAGDVFSSLASTIGDLFSNIGGGGGIGGLFGAIGGFFQDGGVVPGAEGQAVPIVAHAGEVVLNREQQARLLEGGAGNTNVNIDLGITGNIDRQTRTNIMQMIPEIAGQINQYNRERGTY